MDLEKRREELEQTRAGERSDDEQRTRPWEGGTPRETTAAGEPATPTAELLTGGGGQTKPEPGAPSEETRLEALESGKVIGPFEPVSYTHLNIMRSTTKSNALSCKSKPLRTPTPRFSRKGACT